MPRIHDRKGMQCLFVVAFTVVAAFAPGSHAETIYYYEPHTGFREKIDTANPGRHASGEAPQSIVGGTSRGATLTFNVTYMDVTNNTNVGFDDPSLGATRQTTLEAVLSYVNGVLNEATGATIDVKVNASQTDSTGFLASAGTYFSGTTGFTNGFCFQHITSGADPSGAVEDIFITVDFGYNWNSDLGPVGGSEFDLFTVLLHEVTHGLGLLGLAASNGKSAITSSNPGQYSVLNRLTQLDDADPVGTDSSTPLWTTSGGASYVGTAGNLTSGRLVFTGTNSVAIFGSNPTINSNSPFVSGTNQSHWGDDLAGLAVMPGFVFNGTEIREYALFEMGALKDIGYTHVVTNPSDVWIDFSWTGTEQGTFDNPFNTLAEGVNAISSDGMLHIQAGETSEILTINKAVQAEALNGIVRIGVQTSRQPRTGFISPGSR